MTKNLLLLQLFCVLQSFMFRAQTMMVDTFFYTGTTQTFAIPTCASNLTVMLHGAQGGSDTLNGGWPGGFGGRIYVVMTTTPGALLYVNVGGPGHRNAGGWNGGGRGGAGLWSPGGGGGGSSDIRIGGNTLSDRAFVAAGGGGGSGFRPQGYCVPTNASYGGSGGGYACMTAFDTNTPSCPPTFGCGGEDGNSPALSAACSGNTVSGDGAGGGGGGLTSGGGTSNSTNGCQGTAGSLLQGGAGGDSLCANTYSLRGFYGGGGGGGGYYGGGGGHSGGFGNSSCPASGAGGGGSTYLNSSYVITYSLWGGNVGTAGIYNPITHVNSGAVTFSYMIGGPDINITASQNTICAGASATLTTGSLNSYTWLPTGNFSGSNNASISVSPIATTQYTVQGLTSQGCLSRTVTTIYVNANTLSVTANPSFSVCSGQPLTLSASGASTFSWSGSIQNNVPFTPTAAGVYTVISSNSLGCTASATAGVLILPHSTISISPLSPAVCPGGSINLLGSGATSYTWSSGQTGPTITASPSVSTVYYLTGNPSGTNMACPSMGSTQVMVYPIPVLTVTASQTLVCLNETVTVAASGANSYTWLPTGNFGGSGSASVSVNPVTTAQYTVIGSNNQGCLNQTVVSIYVNVNTLSVTANPAFSVCSGQALSLSASGASTFSWSGGIQNTISFTPQASGVYTVSSTNSLGCTSSATAGVLVVPRPTVSLSPLFPAVCPGYSIHLIASGAASYSWSSGQTGPMITVSPSVSTIYSLSASASGTDMSCPASGSTQVIVYPVPVLTVSATQTLICLNETVTVAAGGAISYTWTSANGPSIVNGGSMVVSPTTNITYSVTGMAGNQCLSNGAVSIQVDACTGIADLEKTFTSLFPNPTQGTFYIHSNTDAQLEIYSPLGKRMDSAKLIADEKKEFHLSSPGLYIIHYQSGQQKNTYKLLVID